MVCISNCFTSNIDNINNDLKPANEAFFL
jgi:hypothetical protein